MILDIGSHCTGEIPGFDFVQILFLIHSVLVWSIVSLGFCILAFDADKPAAYLDMR